MKRKDNKCFYKKEKKAGNIFLNLILIACIIAIIISIYNIGIWLIENKKR